MEVEATEPKGSRGRRRGRGKALQAKRVRRSSQACGSDGSSVKAGGGGGGRTNGIRARDKNQSAKVG